jgi:hypothetical protein
VGDPLYERIGDRFIPTDVTRSPWGPEFQHGGPACALTVREVERVAPPDMAVLRFAVDILRPIPVAPLHPKARVVRSGRRVQLVEVVVEDNDGAVLLAAHVWTIRRRDQLILPDPADPRPEGPPPLDTLQPFEFTFADYTWFGDALEGRLAGGRIAEPGRATMWARLRGPVVHGEEPTALQRLAAMADSGNGISWALPFHEYLFINTDLSIYLIRDPAGEWFALDSVSHYDPSGRGLAATTLFDGDGYVGQSQQALYVDLQGR